MFGQVDSALTEGSALAEAAALGLAALSDVIGSALDGITVIDSRRRFVYANTAACEMLGLPLAELRGRDFLTSIVPREHATILARLSERRDGSAGGESAVFTCSLTGPGGVEREMIYSHFTLDIDGQEHGVAIFQDISGPRTASRAASLLAQTISQLLGSASADEILADIAHRAVDATRALACGMATVHDGTLTSAGGYGLDTEIDSEARTSLRKAFSDVSGDEVIEAMTGGAIVIGAAPGKPVVLSDARSMWRAHPVTRPWEALVAGLDWEAGVYAPLSWRNRVLGVFAVYLPAGMAGPSEAELAFYTALADHAAVAHINSRLSAEARQAASSVERARLARELHDSVSQGLFSMTMHARAAHMSMTQAGLDVGGPLGRSILELADLTRGALAEMRALIFELRPATLAEEGLVAGLRKQAAALSARELAAVTVTGPEARLKLEPEVEEHLYRIASEALRNVIKHSGATSATVSVDVDLSGLSVEVRDDGVGFDPAADQSGHQGLRSIAERAEMIAAQLTITSRPGEGSVVTVSIPAGAGTTGAGGQASDGSGARVDRSDELTAGGPTGSATAGTGREREGEGGSSDAGWVEPQRPGAAADASALGVTGLAGVLVGAREGILIADPGGYIVYANPAVCAILGRSPGELRGAHFLSVVPAREHAFRRGRFSEVHRGFSTQFSGTLLDSEGGEHETVYAGFQIQIAGSSHSVAFIRDVTDIRTAARAAVGLAQAASQLVGDGSTDEILADIATHAVEGTRGVACGISTVGEDGTMAEAGGYGPWNTGAGAKNTGWSGFSDGLHADVISALTGDAIAVGETPGPPLVLPDVRAVWARYEVLKPLVDTLTGDTLTDELPGGGVFFPLAWEGRVVGLFTLCLPSGVAGPTEAELAFCTALADQAAVAVANSRLNAQVRQAAALAERTRLAQELHDSISQALFSMTMHARAAQLAMADAGVDETGPLGDSVAELAALARGTMAEMRALIFELRPGALIEEGLVAALGKQTAALTARAATVITVQGPERRLDLDPTVEEHLYRIASEALHNVVKHAGAASATVTVTDDADGLALAVRDDGNGFDPGVERRGHFGLSTMAERAAAIGADLTVLSAPGDGTAVRLCLPRPQRPQDEVVGDVG